MKPIDLRTCKRGARLLTRGGNTMIYSCQVPGHVWGHLARHPDLGYADTYTDAGFCVHPTYPNDNDIVKILDTGSTSALRWLFYFALGVAVGAGFGRLFIWLVDNNII